jgi:hypothetical protein
MKETKVVIHVEEALDASQRSLLGAKLEEEKGILSAWFQGDDPHRLAISYDQEHFSHETLLDLLEEQGARGQILAGDEHRAQ